MSDNDEDDDTGDLNEEEKKGEIIYCKIKGKKKYLILHL